MIIFCLNVDDCYTPSIADACTANIWNSKAHSFLGKNKIFNNSKRRLYLSVMKYFQWKQYAH